jgi:hypothetical protein
MGQRSVSHLPKGRTTRISSCAVALAVVVLNCLTAPAMGAVSLSPSRTDLLYSTDANPDCSALFEIKDDTKLPFNVVRIRVLVDNASPTRPLGYRWSIRKPVGILAADLDLGPGEQTPDVSGMCADFGNACVLTEDRLRFYSEPSILWIAPTCRELPTDTSQPFHGGVVRIRVKVSDGRRRLGTATVAIGFGRNGSVTLFVNDLAGKFENGLRKREVATGFDASFAAKLSPPTLAPGPGPVVTYDIDNGGGGSASLAPGCSIVGFDACERIDYPSAGRFLASVIAKFDDGSALCDNLNVRVVKCSPAGQVEIIPRPKLATYDPARPGSTVDLTVRLHNKSQAQGGLPACPFGLRGENVLSCSESVKVGGVTDSRTTTFDLKHCSVTTDQPCENDARCEPGETCLTRPHCSKTLKQLCGNDADCDPTGQPPRCMDCKPGETCIRVLELGVGGEVLLQPGQSIDLFHQTVTLRNDLPGTAKMVDTWTATTENAGSYDARFRYRIRGRPGQ